MADLMSGQRRSLPRTAFAIPEKAPGSGSYPIPDAAHARNALARVSQFGTSAEKARVRAAVKRKFPNMGGEMLAKAAAGKGMMSGKGMMG